MTWRHLFATAQPVTARTERFVDWSIHALTALVLVTLVACVGFLLWRWIHPLPPPSTEVAVKAVERLAAASQDELPAPSAAGAEVLLSPAQMYRCERFGRVSYSDRPCAEGLARVMTLPERK